MSILAISPALNAYHEANRYEVIFSTEALCRKKYHIGNVIIFGDAIATAQHLPVNKELLKLCLEHHDDGRVGQYRLLDKFWDTEVSHNVLGADRLEKFIQKESLSIDESLELLRNVMLYHGRLNLLGTVSKETRLYVELVTTADDFENACSCVSYLVKEVNNDEKGYIKANPSANQLEVSEFVFSHFKNGEKFDKLVHCHTYAEYVLFAATLATSCIKKYGDIARSVLTQPGYGFESILAGYKDVFEKTLNSNMAKDAYHILYRMI